MLIGNLIEYWKTNIKNEFNPYRDYLRIKGSADQTEAGESILITNIIGGFGHTFEGLYGRKAAIKGKNVYFLRCGNFLKKCDSLNAELSHRRLRCELCQTRQKEFISAFGGHDLTYEMYLGDTELKQIDKLTAEYINNGLDKPFYYESIHINKILYSALQRYYLLAQPDVKDNSITRQFLFTIFATIIVMDKICNEIHPRYVLTSHGTYSTWGAIVEYCKIKNIYVITHGQNYNHCGIEFTYDDSYLTGVINDTENKWEKHELSVTEKSKVIRFLDERLGKVNDDNVAFDYNKNNKKHFNRSQIAALLGIDPDRKLVGMFPNIPWDGQVTGGSTVFPGFKDWLKYTVDYFSKIEKAALIIRAHPAEVNIGTDSGKETTAKMLYELYEELPPNVILLDPKHEINSYTLGENVDFGITFSSTVTLELTYLGIPVILCGCPPFKDKNIAFDIASTEEYQDLLTKGINGELVVDDDRKERLFQYLHYFFFMRTMPQTLVEVKDASPVAFTIDSEKELDEDEVFEYLFHCIENKAEMDFSRYWK